MVGEKTVPPRKADRTSSTESSVEDVGRHLNEAREFIGVYVAAQMQRVRVVLRNVFLFCLLSVFALLVMSTVAVVSVVLVCEGAAGGIGALLGDRTWAGELIVGCIVLGGAILFAWRLISHVRKIARRQTISGYLKTKVPRT